MIRLKYYHFFWGFILLLIPIELFGQRSIKGHITDFVDGKPVLGVTVFINGTTVGVNANEKGFYRLEIPGEGSYELTVSCAGYQPAYISIDPGKASIVCDVAMNRFEEEETATSQTGARQKDITFFQRALLGKSPSKRTIYVLNPEVVFYNFNSETQILYVTCREPLQIINNETGYQLHVVLDHFAHNYLTGLSSWKTELKFTALIPDDLRQKSVWDINRLHIYNISKNNFSDETIDNTVMLSPMLSSNSLTGLNMKLPVDYIPDMSLDNADIFALIEGSMSYPFKHITDSVFDWFNAQLEVYPQEKIHLHTDRDVYVSGEKIRFKAYVTDALTLVSSLNSRYVYVELISPSDSLIKRVMVRPVDGIFYGNLPLVNYVPTGNYTLRAYTRYMENLGDDYFFKKNIRIENPATANRSPARREILSDDYEVSFFPEGGNLPEGVLCNVAFKALNSNGYPETITGVLVDETGEAIFRYADVPSALPSGTTSIQSFHAGMGVFDYMPEAGKKVYLRCKNSNGLEKQFELPQPNPQACSLTASLSGDSILIGIKSSAQTPDVPYYLLAHCRGEVLYFSEWDNGEENVSGRYGRVPGLESGRDGRVPGMLFTRDEFPAGIIQFVLFDEQMNALSERLVFNKNYDEAKVAFNTDKSSYKKREKVMVTLNLSRDIGEKLLLPCHFSVAITDDKDVAVDSSTTILSSLLLSSELKGYIENPAWYLLDTDASAKALDYLMLTHGWRRYNIPEVAKGKLSYPKIPFQMNQEISGTVKKLALSGNVADSEISIMSQEGDFVITTTNSQGVFNFHDFEFPDSVSFFIQALSKSGNNRVQLVMDYETFPELIHATKNPVLKMPAFREETKSEDEANAFITKAEQRSKYDEDMRVIHLSEVEVTAKRIDDPRLQYPWATAGSEMTIRREEFERHNPNNVTDVLKRMVWGKVDSDGLVSVKKGDKGGTVELVIINGKVNYWYKDSDSPLERVAFNAVESIDIFFPPATLGFGVNGVVVSITTRKWDGISRDIGDFNYTVYSPIGYQKPVEFYSPNYETLDAKYLSIPDYRTTLFWKPDIILSDTGKASFEFYTSDFPTTYSVVIEGLTSDGQIIRQVEKIQIE